MIMKMPDFEYILTNSFEKLKKEEFFQPQEVLYGKSICDICVSDPESVSKALKATSSQESVDFTRTILYKLVVGDPLRKKAFTEINQYPENLKINFDFNMESTITRAMHFKSYKSIKLLLEYIFEEDNSNDYYNIIMMHFSEILRSENLNCNQFFSLKENSPEIQN